MSERRKDETEAELLDRQRRALRLRRKGLEFHDIGVALWCSTGEAFELVKAAQASIPTEEVEDERKLALSRLDAGYARCEGIQAALADQCKPTSKAFSLEAIDRVLKAEETKLHLEARRAKLRGLDAPTRSEIGGHGGGPVLFSLEEIVSAQATADANARAVDDDGENSGDG